MRLEHLGGSALVDASGTLAAETTTGLFASEVQFFEAAALRDAATSRNAASSIGKTSKGSAS